MTNAQRHSRFKQLVDEAVRYENEWTGLIADAMMRQRAPLITALKEKGYKYALDNVNDLVIPGPMDVTLSTLYERVGVKAANSEYGVLNALYGAELRGEKNWQASDISYKFFGFNRLWRNVLRGIFNTIGGEKVKNITDTERARIRRILENATQEEQTDRYLLARKLQDRNIDLPRGRTISRTETGTASSIGGNLGAKKSGLLLKKTWLSVQDSRVRHLPEDAADHRIMNNVSVQFAEKFLVPVKGGFELLDHPHDPDGSAENVINCRCKAVYEAMRDAQGRLIRSQAA